LPHAPTTASAANRAAHFAVAGAPGQVAEPGHKRVALMAAAAAMQVAQTTQATRVSLAEMRAAIPNNGIDGVNSNQAKNQQKRLVRL
jgi:hypothetical protein